MNNLNLYRSVIPNNGGQKQFSKYHPTMRPPGNVPYIVDNLWEWKRSDKFPCRRLSAYASPTPELALNSGAKGGVAFRLEFEGEVKIAQLQGYADSKFHPDCKKLANLMFSALNKITGEWWLNQELKEKAHPGQLWVPCLRKSELDYLFENIPVLKSIKDEVASKITYWDDVEIIDPEKNSLTDLEGEIFFEAKGGYHLLPI